MKALLELQSNFESPLLLTKRENILYFVKGSPFKDTCNEDALGIFPVDNGFVFAVADGAGGHPKGEEAAQIVLSHLETSLKYDSTSNIGLRSLIVDAIENANKELLSKGNGSRTTVTVCEVVGNKARGYQVGDSTLLICGQKGKLKYRSTSHSPVGYGVEAGLIDEKEALAHPDLHYMSNLLGETEMKIEIGPEVELNANDSIFLASDGLFDNFSPEEIVTVIRKGSMQEISETLMDWIENKIYKNENAKIDDISFILFKNIG